MTLIRIHYNRPGKQPALYTEGFLAEDAVRLTTRSIVPVRFSRPWSSEWQRLGLLPVGGRITEVKKYIFYDRFYSIMEVCGAGGNLLGYYCDIATPLRKYGNEYYLTDLCLDLWIYPGGEMRELDWDDFERACTQGLISPGMRESALEAFESLKTLVRSGDFYVLIHKD